MQHQPLLTLAVVWLVIYLLPPILIVVALMRTRLEPTRLRSGEPGPANSADELDAMAELAGLGFELVSEDSLQVGSRCYGHLLFSHPQFHIFADLILQPQLGNSFPVTFYSLTAAGQLLATVNRQGFLRLAVPDDVALQDAAATSLQGHWQAHRERLATSPVVACTVETMRGRIAGWIEGYLPLLRSRGLCRERDGVCTPTLGAALGAARAWQKNRRRLSKRYASAVTDGAHQALYYARCYEEWERLKQARTSRRDVKVGVLALSVVVSFLLWSWVFSPASAIALTVVLLVHEGGHALAMRAFGYRDINMFFLPFFGAVVTGDARSLAAWKQGVILFAGPLPGLIAGAVMTYYWNHHPVPPGFNWKMAATMALYVNLFNLLPIIPLDGGRLVELSLFGRWPRLRIVFGALSALGMIGVSLWSKSPVWIILAVTMVMALRTQWRATTLERNWQPEMSLAEQIRHLFEIIRQRWPGQLVSRQIGMVRTVVQQRSARAARLWESGLILLMLGAVWSTVGVASHFTGSASPGQTRHASARPRSVAPASNRHSADDALVAGFKRTVTAAVNDGAFESLEALATQLRQQDLKSPSGIPQLFLFYYNGVKGPVEGIPIERKDVWDRAFAFADRWMQARPDSPTPILVKSELLLAYGWQARGPGYMDTVSRNGARVFQDSMQEASDLLQRTRAVSSRDPDWYRQMAAIYKNTAGDRTEFMALLEEAMTRYPSYWPTFTNGAQYVLPKWGGSDEGVRAYVRHLDQLAPVQDADVLYARIYSAIGCCGYTGPELFTIGGAKWGRMKKGLESIRTQFPDPLNVDTEAVNACRAGDPETLRNLLGPIGNDPVLEAWTNSIEYFHACRDYALGNPASGGNGGG